MHSNRLLITIKVFKEPIESTTVSPGAPLDGLSLKSARSKGRSVHSIRFIREGRYSTELLHVELSWHLAGLRILIKLLERSLWQCYGRQVRGLFSAHLCCVLRRWNGLRIVSVCDVDRHVSIDCAGAALRKTLLYQQLLVLEASWKRLFQG